MQQQRRGKYDPDKFAEQMKDPKFRKMRVRQARRYQKTPIGRAKVLHKLAQSRAKAKGYPCTITEDWVLGRIIKGKCEATGMDLVLVQDGRHPQSPSLDKIDPNLGYTPDNTQVVVCMYNYAKGCFSHEDVVRMAEALCSKTH